MKDIDTREFIAGAALVATGLFVALYASSHYEIGEPARMGPGFFPTALGWILGALGVIVIVFSFRQAVHAWTPPPFALRPFLAVVTAVAAFSVFIDRIGLMPTALILAVVASFANRNFKLGRALLLGVFLAVLSWLIFTVGLKMTLPAFKLPG
jgi:hypothetical protein